MQSEIYELCPHIGFQQYGGDTLFYFACFVIIFISFLITYTLLYNSD